MNLQCILCFPLAPLSFLKTWLPATFVNSSSWQLAHFLYLWPDLQSMFSCPSIVKQTHVGQTTVHAEQLKHSFAYLSHTSLLSVFTSLGLYFGMIGLEYSVSFRSSPFSRPSPFFVAGCSMKLAPLSMIWRSWQSMRSMFTQLHLSAGLHGISTRIALSIFAL